MAVLSAVPCDCCAPLAAQDGDGCPARPAPPVESGTCLCHGAVMDRDVEAPDPDHAPVTFRLVDPGTLCRDSASAAQNVATDQIRAHFTGAVSGRELRALLASLLI